MSVVSSNKVLLKLPIVHKDGQRYFDPAKLPPATTVDSAASNGKSENEDQRGIIEEGGRDREEGEGRVEAKAEAERKMGESGQGGLYSSTSEGSRGALSKTDISEGRTMWKGECLKPLRTPLFMLEIAAVGEKGKEVFVYVQKLGAVKESVLMLIDKAVASTQVMAAAAGLRRLECPR